MTSAVCVGEKALPHRLCMCEFERVREERRVSGGNRGSMSGGNRGRVSGSDRGRGAVYT